MAHRSSSAVPHSAGFEKNLTRLLPFSDSFANLGSALEPRRYPREPVPLATSVSDAPQNDFRTTPLPTPLD